MVEGRIRFEKDGERTYRVYTDCIDGKMTFVGRVEKRLFPRAGWKLPQTEWWGKTINQGWRGPHSQRRDAAQALF